MSAEALDAGWPWPLDGVQEWFENLWNSVNEWIELGIIKLEAWVYANVTKPLSDLLGSVSEGIGKIPEEVGKALEANFKAIHSLASQAYATITQDLSNLGASLSLSVNELKTSFTSGLSTLGGNLVATLGSIAKATQDQLGELGAELSSSMDQLGASIKGYFDGAGLAIAEAFNKGFGDLGASISSAFGGFVAAIPETISKVGETLAKGFNEGVIRPLTDALSWVGKWFGDMFSALLKPWLDAVFTPLHTTPDEAKARVMELMKLAIGLVAPFGIAALAGELVHPLKRIGLDRLAAIAWDAAGFSRIVGEVMSAVIGVTTILPLRYALYEATTPLIPREEEVLRIAQYGVLTHDEFLRVFRRMGFSDYWGELFWATHWSTVSFRDLAEMVWRGLITEERMEDLLKYAAYPPDIVAAYKGMLTQIPAADDLVTMVVKEAFPLEELPPAPKEFVKYMKMKGFSEEWSKAYWWIHWRMPSFEHLQNAFWRGIISKDEFMKYIVWWDYPAFKRPGIHVSDQEIMAELIYDLPGRIDVRWMLRWGIIGPDEAENLLKMRGLHPDWIKKVAEAEYLNQMVDARTLAKNAYISMYESGMITRDVLSDELAKLRFIPDEVNFLVTAADAHKRKELNDLYVDYLVELWKRGKISRADFEKSLEERGFDPDYVSAYADLLEAKLTKIDQVDYTRDERTSLRTTLVYMFKEGLITEDDLRSQLTELGFSNGEIELTVRRAREEYRLDYYRDLLAALKEAFHKGVISEGDFLSALVNYGLARERAEAIVAKEVYRRMPTPKPPKAS